MGLLLSLAIGPLLRWGLTLAQFGGATLAALGTAWLTRHTWAARGGAGRLVLPPGAFVLVGVGAMMLTVASLTLSAGEHMGLLDQ
ncbi:hypothetical protein ABZ946_14740 [Streptomyces sp. NPDC046324]|uniref:hypothetical protein n=1 Tax=Streptomyces sp. NPDC046324 TaxID=3154915 RepID=UPI0033D5CC4F